MLVGQVLGGTNSIGVPADAFAMPPGMRMRYDLPDVSLAEYVTGYAIYAADDRKPMVNWYLPAPAMLSITIDAGPIDVSIGNHRFGPLERASLYGPTSRAFRTVTTGGVAVGIGLSALGWARMIGRPAADYHNRIAPLSSILGPQVAERFTGGLDAVNDDAMIKLVLDSVLAPMFTKRHPHEDLIRAFTRLMVTDGVIEMKDVADQLDIPTHELRRMATRHFGMPPKLLLRRSRFLRSFIGLIRADGLSDYSGIDSSYFDASHFLRDASTFLGTTPRRFVSAETLYLKASLRARAAVIGAPTQALHGVARKTIVSATPRPDDARARLQMTL